MPPSAHHHLASVLARRNVSPSEDAAENNKLTTTLVIGIVIAVIIVVGMLVWVGIRFWRKKNTSQREDDRGAAFLNVKGVVKEGDKSLGIKGDLFSREQMADGVVMPEKTILRSNASPEEIREHHAADGTLPRPFAPFMTGEGGLQVPQTPEEPVDKRSSTASWISMAMPHMPRNSFLSAHSNRSSVSSMAIEDGDKRKIRQIYTPVLPDELVVSLGERFSVVNSYDDGWCIVGRDSIFKPGEVELGAIPAWCFMKPVQGLRTERPMRTTSLGVTITLNAPAGPRDNVLSWSNF